MHIIHYYFYLFVRFMTCFTTYCLVTVSGMECIFIVLHCITYVSGKPIRPFLKGEAVKEQVQKELRSQFF
jgi:hypothetical protein